MITRGHLQYFFEPWKEVKIIFVALFMVDATYNNSLQAY